MKLGMLHIPLTRATLSNSLAPARARSAPAPQPAVFTGDPPKTWGVRQLPHDCGAPAPPPRARTFFHPDVSDESRKILKLVFFDLGVCLAR